jgi:CRISPR/Cas system-associated protein endoribonuclease Cas2
MCFGDLNVVRFILLVLMFVVSVIFLIVKKVQNKFEKLVHVIGFTIEIISLFCVVFRLVRTLHKFDSNFVITCTPVSVR